MGPAPGLDPGGAPAWFFAPYTDIPTNVLFFQRGGPTRQVWYYELLRPAGRKKYTKTQPLRFEEFADLLAWWGNREETAQAWRVDAAELAGAGYNLDRKNPEAAAAAEHLPPEQLIEDILSKEREIVTLLEEIKAELAVPEGVA